MPNIKSYLAVDTVRKCFNYDDPLLITFEQLKTTNLSILNPFDKVKVI